MNRHKISPNAIGVALFGLAISSYVGIANKSILGFFILILLTIVGAVLVNRIKNRGQVRWSGVSVLSESVDRGTVSGAVLGSVSGLMLVH